MWRSDGSSVFPVPAGVVRSTLFLPLKTDFFNKRYSSVIFRCLWRYWRRFACDPPVILMRAEVLRSSRDGLYIDVFSLLPVLSLADAIDLFRLRVADSCCILSCWCMYLCVDKKPPIRFALVLSVSENSTNVQNWVAVYVDSLRSRFAGNENPSKR